MSYRERVNVTGGSAVGYTISLLNKCLFITSERPTNDSDASKSVATAFSDSKSVGEVFGNNSKIFKVAQQFLGQTSQTKGDLIPEFFTVLSISNAVADYLKLAEALEEVQTEYYAIFDILDDSIATVVQKSTFCKEQNDKKIWFVETKEAETAVENRLSRIVYVYNPDKDNDIYRAPAYMATVITSGAGSKSCDNVLQGVKADTLKIDLKNKLVDNFINFTELSTNKEYVTIGKGFTADNKDVTVQTIYDAVTFNLRSNVAKHHDYVGYYNGDDGEAELYHVCTTVMNTLAEANLIAKVNGQIQFIVEVQEQTEEDRSEFKFRTKISFMPKGYAKYVDIILYSSNKEVVVGGELE